MEYSLGKIKPVFTNKGSRKCSVKKDKGFIITFQDYKTGRSELTLLI